MAKIQQTRSDLEAHLRKSVARLRAAIAGFDHGDIDQAAVMAVTLRVLLHDTATSKSLLGQLGLLGGLTFVDSRGSVPRAGALLFTALAGLRLGRKMKYEANLDALASTDQSFPDWWGSTVLIVPHPSERRPVPFSRRNLVLTVANQDGGAHIDPQLDETYYTLTRGNLMGELAINGKPVSWEADPVPAHIRQITHEVLKTLEREGLA